MTAAVFRRIKPAYSDDGNEFEGNTQTFVLPQEDELFKFRQRFFSPMLVVK